MWAIDHSIKEDTELYAMVSNRIFNRKFSDLYGLPAYCFDDRMLLIRLIDKLPEADCELFIWGDEIAKLIRKYDIIDNFEFVSTPKLQMISDITTLEYTDWGEVIGRKLSYARPTPPSFIDRMLTLLNISCVVGEDISPTERYYIRTRRFPENVTAAEFYEVYNRHDGVTMESIRDPELQKILINGGFS
jgi:hypothetical protein